ncbi:MAG: class I SAM-dependent methyltransferase [Planctomycetota bacterium]
MDDRRDFDRRYFEIVRAWLEMRFRERDEAGCFKAHEPVYGLGRGHTEGHHCRRAIRLHDLLATVKWLGVEGSLLDVGAAEGYFPHLARTALGLDAWASDLSREACLRAAELFGLPAVPANAGALPFPDDAFDVVTIAEVIEHVADPVGTLLELQRVARRFVVFSTEEWREDEALRDHILGARRLENHMERNIYAPSDLPVLFGGRPRVRWAQRFPVDGPEIADEVFDEAALARLLDGRPPSVEGGTIVVVAVGEESIPEGRPSLHDPAIAAAIARNVSTPESRLEVARGAILERIACPLCGGRPRPRPAP